MSKGSLRPDNYFKDSGNVSTCFSAGEPTLVGSPITKGRNEGERTIKSHFYWAIAKGQKAARCFCYWPTLPRIAR